MTVQEAYTTLMYRLFDLYDDRESANIANMVIENITDLQKIDRILNKKMLLNPGQMQQFAAFSDALLLHKPVQYVLNEAWFAAMKFYVNENVLIPRPETEELVNWVVKETIACNLQTASILDIGTGSGCIPIALKSKLTGADIHGLDVSGAALDVAKINAAKLQASVKFYQYDILNEPSLRQFSSFDIIVSNPPYIKQSENVGMRQNVLLYEPHLALFVPDDDALMFYKAIAVFGLNHLTTNGLLFFEINEVHAKEVAQMLSANGYKEIETRVDLQGKERMIKAKL